MGIDDILAEQAQIRGLQQPQTQPRNQTQPRREAAVLSLDLGGMSREDAMFWMNVAQTMLLAYIALRML